MNKYRFLACDIEYNRSSGLIKVIHGGYLTVYEGVLDDFKEYQEGEVSNSRFVNAVMNSVLEAIKTEELNEYIISES